MDQPYLTNRSDPLRRAKKAADPWHRAAPRSVQTATSARNSSNLLAWSARIVTGRFRGPCWKRDRRMTMTEAEFEALMRDRVIVRSARNFPLDSVEGATFEDAIACWTAMNVNAWLMRWPGQQSLMVLRVWYFWD